MCSVMYMMANYPMKSLLKLVVLFMYLSRTKNQFKRHLFKMHLSSSLSKGSNKGVFAKNGK